MITGRSRVYKSEYMNWAKLRSQSRYNLATSGLDSIPLAELGEVNLDQLEISGPSRYGFAPLQDAIAEKENVSPDCVVAAAGTSMANHLAMAGLIEPGDEVLIEHPTYELLLSTASFLGADIRRFKRSFEDGFKIDPSRVEAEISPRTKLIVITNLNNPSGELTDCDTLRDLAELAAKAGARVLVDEVYLDASFDRPQKSSFHLSELFVVTNSLTKVYGLSGLRCGWILAEPELANRFWRLNDLFGSIPAHPAELLSVIALQRLPGLARRSREITETNNQLLNDFYESRDDLEYIRQGAGTVSFPRLRHGSVEDLTGILREHFETTVVPGSFFEMPEHFRLGLGGDPDIFAEGLNRLGSALDLLKMK